MYIIWHVVFQVFAFSYVYKKGRRKKDKKENDDDEKDVGREEKKIHFEHKDIKM